MDARRAARIQSATPNGIRMHPRERSEPKTGIASARRHGDGRAMQTGTRTPRKQTEKEIASGNRGYDYGPLRPPILATRIRSRIRNGSGDAGGTVLGTCTAETQRDGDVTLGPGLMVSRWRGAATSCTRDGSPCHALARRGCGATGIGPTQHASAARRRTLVAPTDGARPHPCADPTVVSDVELIANRLIDHSRLGN